MPLLASLLYNAPSSKPLKLGIAEYQGTALLSTPLHIIGVGRGSALWSYHSPVLVIMTPGVILENVLFDVTGEQSGTHIWYAPNCQPQLINCYPQQVEMKQMTINENIIHLGILSAEQAVDLPIMLDKNMGWRGFDTLPDGVQIRALDNNRHGHRGFIMGLTVPKDEGYFYATLTPKTATGNDVCHVFGRIERKPTVRHTKSLCLTIQGRRIHFGEGLELTNDHLLHASQTPHQDGIYGWFIKEKVKNDVVWVFWLPNTPPQGIRIDGTEIPRWSRVVLTVGMNFQFGGITGVIEDVDDVPVNMPSIVPVTLTDLSANDFSVQVTTNAGFFQNLRGGKSWIGAVDSLVDWLEVPPGHLTITKDFMLPLRINEKIMSYPNGALLARNVVLLQNQHDIFSFSLGLMLSVPDYLVVITPPIVPIQFEDGKPLHQGEVQGARGRVELTNHGRGDMTINLKSHAPEIIIPPKASQITLGSKQSVQFPLEFSDQANFIPQGIYEKPDAIHITGSVQAVIGVRAEIKESNLPQIRFEDIIQFPEYNIAYPPKTAFTAGFHVTNWGNTPVEYRLHIARGDNAVHVSQLSGTLTAGGKQKILVTIPPDVLQSVQQASTEAIEFQLWGNRIGANEQQIPNQILVFTVVFVNLYPKMTVNPAVLDLPDAIAGQPYNINKVVDLINEGSLSFMATITNNVPWLTLMSSPTCEVKAGDRAEIRVESNGKIKDLAPGLYDIPNALTVDGTPSIGKVLHIGVRLYVSKAEARPHISTKTVNFGAVQYGTKLAKDTVIIGNYGYAPWQAIITSHIGHISAPAMVEIPPGMVAEIEVQLDTTALAYGAYYWDSMITIAAHNETNVEQIFKLNGYAIIEQPQAKLVFEPATVQFDNLLQGTILHTPQTVMLKNVGTQTWQNNPQLIQKPDWLVVNPQNITLDMGIKKPLELSLSANAQQLPAIIYTDELILSDGNSEVHLPISLEVCHADISISPIQLTLMNRSLPQNQRLKNNTLTITNNSRADFILIIAPKYNMGANLIIPSLFTYYPSDSPVTIKPGESHAIALYTNGDPQGTFNLSFTPPNNKQQLIAVSIM